MDPPSPERSLKAWVTLVRSSTWGMSLGLWGDLKKTGVLTSTTGCPCSNPTAPGPLGDVLIQLLWNLPPGKECTDQANSESFPRELCLSLYMLVARCACSCAASSSEWIRMNPSPQVLPTLNHDVTETSAKAWAVLIEFFNFDSRKLLLKR